MAENLIRILQQIQEHKGYVSEADIAAVSRDYHIPVSEILGVITFYAQFRLKPVGRHLIMVCQGTACHVNGASDILSALSDELGIEPGETTTDGLFTLESVSCLGCCAKAPAMMVVTSGESSVYGPLTVKSVHKIIKDLRSGKAAEASPEPPEDPEFVAKQNRFVLSNCGVINPESIESAEKAGAYKGLDKVLKSMTPREIIDEIKLSGLRGRGGAGFPTWFKWDAARRAQGDDKYLICNGDEGDPGAFMDRSLLENDPHSVIEGMLIAAYAIGASHGFIYVRAEYPLAIKRLEIAIKQAYDKGYLGHNILGCNFDFDLEIRAGAGAFVCGEETALIASLEGKRGMPVLKPPFPAEKGYMDKPSDINNVETLANVPRIIMQGGKYFASLGTEDSAGTKVFALAGKVKHGGLVEVPMGTTLRQIIYDIGGGLRDGGEVKAVQMGGPSGGCIPGELLDTPVDYEHIKATGAIMGSGGMIVMDENTCMVDMARFFMRFTQDESCGKCVHCRIGTKRMLEILDRIVEGRGEDGDIELLEELGHGIINGSLCGLGQSAPNPVLSSIERFRKEYVAHIRDKKCPAHQCKSLLTYSIDADKCRGCGKCASKCPAHAISGNKKQPYVINNEQCVKCGSCKTICSHDAVIAD